MQPSTAAEPATSPEQQAISYDESVERARARIKQQNQTNKRTDDDWDLVDPTKPL
jgi:putative hemolysin